jgi:hypothetical protein
MPCSRAPYVANWPELTQAAKDAARWRCTTCGAQHGALQVSGKQHLYRVVLAACHLDHDPANPALRLTVLCQPCHLRLDAMQHWRTRRRHLRERAVAAGQLEWTPAADPQYQAPLPSSTPPARHATLGQEASRSLGNLPGAYLQRSGGSEGKRGKALG